MVREDCKLFVMFAHAMVTADTQTHKNVTVPRTDKLGRSLINVQIQDDVRGRKAVL